jgi:hypothetical protein
MIAHELNMKRKIEEEMLACAEKLKSLSVTSDDDHSVDPIKTCITFYHEPMAARMTRRVSGSRREDWRLFIHVIAYVIARC